MENYRNLDRKELGELIENGLRRKISSKSTKKELNATPRPLKARMINWLSGAMFHLYQVIKSLAKKVQAISYVNYYKNLRKQRCFNGFKETSGWKLAKIYKKSVGSTWHAPHCN